MIRHETISDAHGVSGDGRVSGFPDENTDSLDDLEICTGVFFVLNLRRYTCKTY